MQWVWDATHQRHGSRVGGRKKIGGSAHDEPIKIPYEIEFYILHSTFLCLAGHVLTQMTRHYQLELAEAKIMELELQRSVIVDLSSFSHNNRPLSTSGALSLSEPHCFHKHHSFIKLQQPIDSHGIRIQQV